MNFNFDLFIDILWLGTLSGIISTVCLSKITGLSKFLNYKLVSFIINIFIGFAISRLFTNLSLKLSLCVGFITWIGAEIIYEKIYSNKILNKDTSLNFDESDPSEEEENSYDDTDNDYEENSYEETEELEDGVTDNKEDIKNNEGTLLEENTSNNQETK